MQEANKKVQPSDDSTIERWRRDRDCMRRGSLRARLERVFYRWRWKRKSKMTGLIEQHLSCRQNVSVKRKSSVRSWGYGRKKQKCTDSVDHVTTSTLLSMRLAQEIEEKKHDLLSVSVALSLKRIGFFDDYAYVEGIYRRTVSDKPIVNMVDAVPH